MLGNLIDIVQGFPDVDLDTAGADADWINMKNVDSVLVLFESGIGTGGDDAALDFEQATTNAGGSSKALSLPATASTRVWKKQAATSLAAVTAWSDASGDVSTAQLTHADGAEQSQMYAVEIIPSDLDVANGFDHMRVTIDDDFSNTQPGCLHYIVRPKYPARPDKVSSYL
tara:strand:- start:64 stop:576 length:513 start_codon:yes stop_codon:yes gene_type:complete